MKLVTCRKCGDTFALNYSPRECQCKAVGGQYMDRINANVWGDPKTTFVIGFANTSFEDAMHAQLKDGDNPGMMPYAGGYVHKGRDFAAFIIPDSAPSVKRFVTKPN